MRKAKVIAVVGPTASGKSALAFKLAQKLQGEMIAMDSMQIYKNMDIGTAKATLQEQGAIPHHMIDIVTPWDSYSVAQYRKEATTAIEQVLAKGKQPILVGGTGLYYQGILQPVELGNTPGDMALRQKLEEQWNLEGGREKLHEELQRKDFQAAGKIHRNDKKRLIRALEVIHITGEPFSAQNGLWQEEHPYDMVTFAIDEPREELYGRINKRTDQMIKEGLLQEVRALLDKGVPVQAQSMQGIGYKELVPVVLSGEDIVSAINSIKQSSRQYAKRQLTWFRRYSHIHWLKRQPQLAEESLKIIENEEMKK